MILDDRERRERAVERPKDAPWGWGVGGVFGERHGYPPFPLIPQEPVYGGSQVKITRISRCPDSICLRGPPSPPCDRASSDFHLEPSVSTIPTVPFG